jgi:hypothetical protein
MVGRSEIANPEKQNSELKDARQGDATATSARRAYASVGIVTGASDSSGT